MAVVKKTLEMMKQKQKDQASLSVATKDMASLKSTE